MLAWIFGVVAAIVFVYIAIFWFAGWKWGLAALVLTWLARGYVFAGVALLVMYIMTRRLSKFTDILQTQTTAAPQPMKP